MRQALIVVEPTTAGEDLLQRAGELCNGIYDKIILLRVIDRNDYTDSLQRKVRSSGDINNIDDIIEEARQTTVKAAEEAFINIDVPYEIITKVGDVPEDIITEAEKRDSDHIFLVGKRRSPTGKAVFGDIAQTVILNFDGFVTLTIDKGL